MVAAPHSWLPATLAESFAKDQHPGRRHAASTGLEEEYEAPVLDMPRAGRMRGGAGTGGRSTVEREPSINVRRGTIFVKGWRLGERSSAAEHAR